jgi:CubicO group peptidase (beta-lactamase class C family)
MAPEQRAGRAADARSDQYAFAVTLDEAMHGDRAPSRKKSRNPLIGRIDAAMARALSVDPLLRYPAMVDLLEALAEPRPGRLSRLGRARALRMAAAVLCVVLASLYAWRSSLPLRKSVIPSASQAAEPLVPDESDTDVAAMGDGGDGALTFAAPDEVGIDARPLIALADWISRENLPILSLVLSRDGAVAYELYTSSVTRDDAHYLMGATAVVTSAVMGAAIDRHIVASMDTTVADALPRELFPNDAARESFRRVTIRDVLSMSVLDASVAPLDHSIATEDRKRQFLQTPNRVRFALTQPLVAEPGKTFAFSDVTPLLAVGILEYAAKKTLLELAESMLFGPMDFRSYEWMHEDAAGIDNGSYGLRLRPVDMQKLGVLYLHDGRYGGRMVLSSEWVREAFTPVVKEHEYAALPSFGAYWRTTSVGPWTAHMAQGWKGQRIAVLRKPRLVVTMTAVIEPPGDETVIFRRVMNDYVLPAALGTRDAPPRPDPSLRAPLAEVLARVAKEPHLPQKGVESRMIPSAAAKERHHGFAGD